MAGLLVAVPAALGCRRVIDALPHSVKDQLKDAARSAKDKVSAATDSMKYPKTASKKPKIPLGMNISGVVYYSTSIPFVDVMKIADEAHSMNAYNVEGGKNPWDTELAAQIPHDSNLYPLELPYIVPGAEAPQILLTAVATPVYGGRYTLTYDGDGDIEFPASENVTVTKLGPGRASVEIAKNSKPFFMSIRRSDRKNPVRNIHLYLPGFDGSDPKQQFHPDFLKRLRGVDTIRFMDWGRTNNSEIVHWSERSTPNTLGQGGHPGVAIETMIDLANEVDADAWLNVPAKADDEYIEEMAKLVKARLNPKHRVYIEYSNEIWNTIFGQHGYAAEQGCKAGLNKLGAYSGDCKEGGPNFWASIKWQSHRSAQIFKTFVKVFGDKSRVVRVLCGQAGFTHLNENLLQAFYDPKINPAGGEVDALGIAPYIAGNLGEELDKSPERNALTPDQIAEKIAARIPNDVTKSVSENKALADRFGVRLIAYEAGQHLIPVGPSIDDELFVSKLINANRVPAMRKIYDDMIGAWLQASDNDLFMLFVYIESPGKFGSWGMLESQTQPTEQAPKFQGYLDRMEKLRAAAQK